jgi:hypothetical protein
VSSLADARDASSHDRTADASCRGRVAAKWHGWILAAAGHGEEWARVLHIGLQDHERLWTAIADAVLHAPVSVVRDRAAHGVICGVDVMLTINDRAAPVTTAWHYADADAAPRLVTAYPSA